VREIINPLLEKEKGGGGERKGEGEEGV